jgi:hypothetical protein
MTWKRRRRGSSVAQALEPLDCPIRHMCRTCALWTPVPPTGCRSAGAPKEDKRCRPLGSCCALPRHALPVATSLLDPPRPTARLDLDAAGYASLAGFGQPVPRRLPVRDMATMQRCATEGCIRGPPRFVDPRNHEILNYGNKLCAQPLSREAPGLTLEQTQVRWHYAVKLLLIGHVTAALPAEANQPVGLGSECRSIRLAICSG